MLSDLGRELFQSSPLGIVLLNFNGFVVQSNKAAQQILGYLNQEMTSMHFKDYTHPDDHQKNQELLDRLMYGLMDNFYLEKRYIRKDGSVFWGRMYSSVIRKESIKSSYIITLIEDISNIKTLEKRFKDIIENLNDWVWEIDSKGLYTYSSPRAKYTLGYESYEIIGKSPFDFMPNYEVERVFEILHPILKGQKPFSNLISINITKDGKNVVLETSGVPFYSDTGEFIGYRGVDRDITDRKKMEDDLININVELEDKVKKRTKELEIAHNKLSLMFRNTRDGIAIIDASSKFLDANPSYLKMTGYTLQELLSKSCIEISHKDDIEKSKEVMLKVTQEGYVDHFEKRCLTKDKGIIRVNMSFALIKETNEIIVATRDVTENTRIQYELNKYINIVNDNVITSQADLDGVITNVSTAFCNISGYRREELIGKTHHIVSHPDNPSDMFEKIETCLKENNIWENEVKNIKKDGSHYWTHLSIFPTFNDYGEKTGYTSIQQDITDKKRIEELSITDKLTGVYNRLKLDEILALAFMRKARYNEDFSIAIADLDRFKQINDNFGHLVGDMALKEVSRLIKENIRGIDYFGRWGGEEFMIIFPSTTLESSIAAAEKLRKLIETYEFDYIGKITCSFGLASTKNSADMNSLIKKADDALYDAKRNGRNRVMS